MNDLSLMRYFMQYSFVRVSLLFFAPPSTKYNENSSCPNNTLSSKMATKPKFFPKSASQTSAPSAGATIYSRVEVYATVVAAFSFLCIGLLRAYTSPAITSMKKDLEIFNTSSIPQKEVISWVASSPPLASFIGTILSGPMLQFFGRQSTLVLLTIPYILGWLLIGFAQDVIMILAGRVLTGLAAGISTAGAQLYVSECVRAEVRGTLGFLPSMMLALGVLLGFSASTINVQWRELALIMGSLPVLLFIVTLTIPESPTWLILRRKEEKAISNLKKLRGNGTTLDEIEEEIDALKSAVSQHRRQRRASKASSMLSSISSISRGNSGGEGWRTVMKREIWFPALIAVSLMTFQQFAAANVIIYFCSVILTEAEPKLISIIDEITTNNASLFKDSSKHPFMDYDYDLSGNQSSYSESGSVTISNVPYTVLDHNVSSVIVGLVQFLAFFLSLPLIDRLGRKILLISSAILMALPLALLGFYFSCNNDVSFDMAGGADSDLSNYFVTKTYAWLPLTCLCIFIAAYSIGFGPVPFIIMSEIFPSKARSYLCSLTSFVNHFALFVVIKTFPMFFEEMGPHYTFWLYAASCMVSIIFVVLVVPETKGKTLVEIEKHFTKELVPLIERRDSRMGLP
jgi:facilitated trehalose transporter